MANQPKKYKKFVATAATATLVASAIVPAVSAAEFKDVTGNDHEVAINALAEQGIIKGFTDGTFKPNQTVTRGQVVKLLGRWLETLGEEVPADWKTEQRFTDVATSNQDEELVKYAALTKDAGVFAGSGGKLNAAQTMTRQQMALVLVRAIKEIQGVDLVAEYKENGHVTEISDLDKAHALEQRNAIVALEYAGITKVSVFNPNNSITRGQFASFLYRTINNVLEASVAGVTSIKAINNTTVEVTFEDEVDNVKSLNFVISDLEVKNAAIKQSNKKVVVLTTAEQTADKEYTVSLNEEKVGSFKGIAAVIPTSVDIVEKSQQNVLGNQVTVKAQVTVAEGQSKAGIPVTFNIVNSPYNLDGTTNVYTSALNQPIVVEALTDENGVATYSYTRYASTTNQLTTHDEVQAYATGKPTLRSFSKVYWAAIQPLTITEVSPAGNELNFGAKKVYKVKLAGATYVSGGTSKAQEYYVNIGFKENVNVTPDKAVKAVTVTDATGNDLGYPGQFTTSSSTAYSNNKAVRVKLDANGEATFTLTASDATLTAGSAVTVTPFVFADEKAITAANPSNVDATVNRFDPTELFAQAAPLTFKKIQNLGLTVTNVGVSNAAAIREAAPEAAVIGGVNPTNGLPYANGRVLTAKEFEDALRNTGGRDYTAVLTDNSGKLAPSGTPVRVKLAIGSAKNVTPVVYLIDNNTKRIHKVVNNSYVDLTTDAKGQISYTLVGQQDAYATPTVFVESGKAAGLDDNDLQQKGEIVYFGDAIVNTAKLTVDDKDANTATVSNVAKFTYKTVDQNGKYYYGVRNGIDDILGSKGFVVSFEVTATFFGANVYDNEADAKANLGAATVGGGYLGSVNQGSSSTRTFVVNSIDGREKDGNNAATIYVVASKGTTVSVQASASQATLPNLTASATFTKLTEEGIAAGQSVTGRVVGIDREHNVIALVNSTGKILYHLSYKDAVLTTSNQSVSEDTFEGQLKLGDEVNFTQATDNTKAKFNDATTNTYSNVKVNVESATDLDFTLSDSGLDKELSSTDNQQEVVYNLNGGTVKAPLVKINGNNVVVDGDNLEVAGTQTSLIDANVSIEGNNVALVNNTVTLKNLVIDGDLYIDKEVAKEVVLNNVTVKGNIIIDGAVDNKDVKIIDSTVTGTIEVRNQETIVFSGTNAVNELNIKANNVIVRETTGATTKVELLTVANYLTGVDVAQPIVDYAKQSGAAKLQAAKDALQALITKANAVITANYTDASVAPFNAALTAAKAELAKTTATVASLTSATNALDTAHKGLVAKDPVTVNKTVLNATIAAAKQVDTTGKTAESVKTFTDAIAAAEAVSAKANATQAEVDAADAAVKAAQAGLIDAPRVNATVVTVTSTEGDTFYDQLVGNKLYAVSGTVADTTTTSLTLELTLVDGTSQEITVKITVTADGKFTASFKDDKFDDAVKTVKVKGSSATAVTVVNN